MGIRPNDLSRMPTRQACNFTQMYALGNMYYLMVMNLSHNLLSGAIPDELAGDKKLAVLDLSHNKLEGPVPNSFSTLLLSEINLSNNRQNALIISLCRRKKSKAHIANADLQHEKVFSFWNFDGGDA
ncbi:hypothetical protein E2562_015105 [Oryza meyeriana var. granulata]|uniref:Leucine-rich repeat-containing N-terminal plant-type domain-containing protein n=1 Tax=Oryza meyeriana var. granulata TaxID=110450 RepID=A0A6G1DX02_9ORYZ|nr:hypothetical protein E2562_015105 [Oryza meyeriana var. granulata]